MHPEVKWGIKEVVIVYLVIIISYIVLNYTLYLNFPIKTEFIDIISGSFGEILGIILIIYIVKKVYQQSIKDIGFTRDRVIRNIGLGFVGCIVSLVIFLIVAIAISGISLLIGTPYDVKLGDKGLDIFEFKSSIGMVLYSVFNFTILTSVSEEMFFRGFVYPVIRKIVGIRWAIFLSALFFGLVHGEYGVNDIWSEFIDGVVFAYLYERTKSLIPCIVGHFLMNAKSVILVYFFHL